MNANWQKVMTPEETEEFGAIETSIEHLKKALTALSQRRGKIRNRLVMRVNWRKNHVADQ